VLQVTIKHVFKKYNAYNVSVEIHFFFRLSHTFLLAKIIRPSICGVHQDYTISANPCQQSNLKPCPPTLCVGTCVCQEGYLRATNDTSSPCITCPK
jgi:hypothetical protein